MYRLLLFIVVLGALGCQKDTEPVSPASPEEVLRTYQGLYDRNQFEAAMAYSTPAEQERLAELAVIIRQEMVDSTVLKTTFEALTCQVNGDTALCDCLLQDQYERYQARFQLVRNTQGKWLVDAPHQEELRIDEELDRIMDSLLNADQ